MHDISTGEDIKILVDNFYNKVNSDELLCPVFNDFSKVDWDKHLPIMYRFWGTLLLGEKSYSGSPFPKHISLPVGKIHFERWVKLFIQTIDENFSGSTADEAKLRASNIASIFQARMGITKRKFEVNHSRGSEK